MPYYAVDYLKYGNFVAGTNYKSRWRGFAIRACLILQYHRYLSLFYIGTDYKSAPAGGVLSLVKFVVD